MSSKKLNIVWGIDNNYIPHLAACIASLLAYNSLESFHFYILSLNISQGNKGILCNWVTKQKQDITFIDVDYNTIKNFPIKKSDYISLASYLRLFIPKLLPQNISKVLYADADILFNGPISELFKTDISHYATAAVEDAPNNNPSRLGYDEKFSYFNAGFQVLNLDYLRQINFTEKALDYIKKNHDKIILHDQDVMNALLHGKVLFLPISWNMLDCYYITPPRIARKYKQDLKKFKQNAVIIHFSGPLKPWHHGCRHPLKKLYKKYSKKFTYSDSTDPWEGLRKFPKEKQWMIMLRFPWKYIDLFYNIIQRAKKRLHIS